MNLFQNYNLPCYIILTTPSFWVVYWALAEIELHQCFPSSLPSLSSFYFLSPSLLLSFSFLSSDQMLAKLLSSWALTPLSW